MLLSLIAVVVGLALLAYAADQFVLGAARVALILRVAPIVVGVVVVGFGTSAPEMLVSGLAAGRGEPEVAVGNVVGSNLANLSLLLGVGALLIPLAVGSRVVQREAPMAVAAMVAFAVAVQGGLSRWEGAPLALAMVGALVVVLRGSRDADDPVGPELEELAESDHSLRPEAARTLLGLVGTLAGAQLLLTGALDIASELDLGEGFVGATLVAVGTSLPELVTVVQSARRAETDLIVGNLLGSNLFNSLAVGAIAGLAGAPSMDAPNLTTVGALAAIAAGLLAWAMMHSGQRVTRKEGGVLVAGYLATVPLLS